MQGSRGPGFGQASSQNTGDTYFAKYREADSIIVPPLPLSAADMKPWMISVANAVQAASGRTETSLVRNWLNECRSSVEDPDSFFSTANCPPELVSLESKLNIALRAVLKSCRNQGLHEQLEREDMMRFDHGAEPFGGRRVLREILRFNQLSEEHVTQYALQSFWNMEWFGDKFEQLVAFQNIRTWHFEPLMPPIAPG